MSSTSNIDPYDSNTRSFFTNILPENLINNDRSFSVSLTRLNYENTFNSIKKSPNPHIIIKCSWPSTEDLPITNTHNMQIAHRVFAKRENKDKVNVVTVYIYLKSGFYQTYLELINTINETLSAVGLHHKISFQSDFNKKFRLYISEDVFLCVFDYDIVMLLGFPAAITGKHIQQTYSLKTIEETENISASPIFQNELLAYKTKYLRFNQGLHHSSEEFYNNVLFTPSIVKVYMCELQPNVESAGFSKLLAVCPGEALNNGSAYDYTPVYTQDRRIAASNLKTCHIELKDQNNNRIEFAVGGATYINLTLTSNISDKMSSEYITINSNDIISSKLFPRNTNTDFSIQLPTEFSRGSMTKWTLKLLTGSINPCIFNITEEFNKMIVNRFNLQNKQEEIIIVLPPGYYENIFYLVKTINLCIKEQGVADLVFEINQERIMIRNLSEYSTSVTIPSLLSSILGYSKTLSHTDTIVMQRNSFFKMPFFPQLKLGQAKYLKILCSQLKKSVFASQNEPLLAFIPVGAGKIIHETCFYEFFQPVEHEINTHTISKLDFKITAENSYERLQISNNIPTHFSMLITKYV